MRTILILSIFSFLLAGNEWQQKINKNGVAVYVKTVNDSPIKSVKAVATINASPEKIKQIVTDAPNFPKWVYKCSEGKILKKISDNELEYYQVTKAPFPVSDRDLAAHLIVRQTKDEILVTIKAIPDRVEESKGKIRIHRFDSVWHIKKSGKGSEVSNEVYVDPLGGIPAWLLNSVITEGPYVTTLQLKKLAEK